MRCVSIIFSPFLLKLIPPPQVASSLSTDTYTSPTEFLPPYLSPSFFCMRMHALTAKAYKQYLHVVLNLHNHTFVTTSTKHSMAIQFPTKTSILYFFWGGGDVTLFLLLEMIFDFHNATLCPSFSAFFLYNPLDVGVPQESDKHLQPRLSTYIQSLG